MHDLYTTLMNHSLDLMYIIEEEDDAGGEEWGSGGKESFDTAGGLVVCFSHGYEDYMLWTCYQVVNFARLFTALRYCFALAG